MGTDAEAVGEKGAEEEVISIIRTCGNVTERNGNITLKEARAEIGGYVELLIIPPKEGEQLLPDDEIAMLVDEDGLPKGLQFNRVASAVASMNIFGTAVLLTGGSKLDDE